MAKTSAKGAAKSAEARFDHALALAKLRLDDRDTVAALRVFTSLEQARAVLKAAEPQDD